MKPKTPIKILIVDDRPENLYALHVIFKNSGYELLEAESGEKAIELSKIHEFACIILDVQMPVLDGFQTAQELRALPQTKATPIIFVTAIHRSEEFEIKGYLSGAVDYLFKPINSEILLAKVRIFVELYEKNLALEEALIRANESERLKEVLKTRDEFLSMASHELKTPITPLTLQLQTFIKLLEDDSHLNIEKERLLRMLETSMGQVNRLGRLIHELVDVSKLRAQKLDLHLTNSSLNRIIEKVVEEFEPEIKKSGCSVKINFQQEVSGRWDPFRIEQVVINLLTNALKYGKGNPIEISVSGIEDTAFIEITDKGLGIEEVYLDRIFDRFERAVSGANYAGLGLGLYISREIIQLHQGKISVSSVINEGSTFRVELPLTL